MAELYSMEQENELLTIYKRAFPAAQLTLFQMDYIELNVEDAVIWKQAITYWGANDYRPQSVFKIVEYYKDLAREKGKSQVGKWADTTVIEPQCVVCGKEICFELHRPS